MLCLHSGAGWESDRTGGWSISRGTMVSRLPPSNHASPYADTWAPEGKPPLKSPLPQSGYAPFGGFWQYGFSPYGVVYFLSLMPIQYQQLTGFG